MIIIPEYASNTKINAFVSYVKIYYHITNCGCFIKISDLCMYITPVAVLLHLFFRILS